MILCEQYLVHLSDMNFILRLIPNKSELLSKNNLIITYKLT